MVPRPCLIYFATDASCALSRVELSGWYPLPSLPRGFGRFAVAVRAVHLTSSARGLCYNPRMADQIIDAEMARSLHVDACRAHPLVGWIVMRDPPDYPGKFAARLVTNLPSPYL
jgi:hypothetical protein